MTLITIIEIYDIETNLCGDPSDFETDDCLDLGDDEEYIQDVKESLATAGISYKIY